MQIRQEKAQNPDTSAEVVRSVHKAMPDNATATHIPTWANGNTLPAGLQAKLTVSSPGDAYEQEADRVAEQVMNTHVVGTPDTPEENTVMRKAGGTSPAAHDAPPVVQQALNSGGQSLDASTQEAMGTRFGQDFAHVRVHTDGQAAESARAISARAYTVGSDVVFGAGQYQPGTGEGQRLLAHELTHVVQQGAITNDRIHQTAEPSIQREPTRPRAATGTASIDDLTQQTAKQPGGQVTAGSLAAQEWESLFQRHFTEPDKVTDEVESSHARYIFSNVYGWIDAQHFFAHIQFAEQRGLQGATDEGIKIERNQALIRQLITPGPDEAGYAALLESNLITPESFTHYREDLVIGFRLALDTGLLPISEQEKKLIVGFSDDQIAKLILDNAMSAWSYEDLVSNQLGVQFFRLYGAYVNAGTTPDEVRKRFIDKISEFFARIQVINDPAAVKRKAANLPGKERWTAPKLSLEKARKRFPELFEFAQNTHRIRIAVYDTQAGAEKGKAEVEKAAPSSAGLLYIAPYGMKSYALYTKSLSHFEAVVLKWVIDHAVATGPGGALIEAQPD